MFECHHLPHGSEPDDRRAFKGALVTIDEIEHMDHEALEEELGHEVITTRPRCATLSIDVVKAAAKKYKNERRARQSQEK